MLVDSGKSRDVPLKNLRLLDKEDAEVPVMTVFCALRGVVGEGIDHNEIMEDMLGKLVEARFVSMMCENKYSTILTKGKSFVNADSIPICDNLIDFYQR